MSKMLNLGYSGSDGYECGEAGRTGSCAGITPGSVATEIAGRYQVAAGGR